MSVIARHDVFRETYQLSVAMEEVGRLSCDEEEHVMGDTISDTAFDPAALAGMASELVAAYVSRNRVPLPDLPALISSVHAALAGIGRPPEPAAAKPKPLMPIRKTVTDAYLIRA